MADTDLAVLQLGPRDAAAGLALSTEAHWNQNEADWLFFLSRGSVYGVRDGGGNLIASAALLPYTSGNAWISMVLVTETWRRQGLATKLVDTCLEVAMRQRLTTWLDATPDGARVYGPLGFTPSLQLRRLRLEQAISTKAEAPPSLTSCSIEEFITRDCRAMGFYRSALLTEMGARPDSRLLSSGGAVALVRDGRTARHIGPVLADSAEQALALINEIVWTERGPLLIDAVHEQADFLKGLTNSGWSIERPFQRMRFGRATAPPAQLPFAVAGPEFG
jgi:GNAT superfamily N-acetyltransferase